MTEALILLALLGVLVFASRLLNEPGEAVGVQLTFPRTVKADQVLAAARSLAGLLPPWWRLDPAPSVTLEVRAAAEGIRHVLTMPTSRAEYVTGSLRAAIPGLRVDDESAEPSHALTLARELQAKGDGELRTDTIASGNAGILASLNPLGSDERAVLQYVITPTATNPLARVVGRWIASWRGDDPDPEPVEPQFAVAIRAAVVAPSAPRSRQLIARLLGSFHALNGPEARLIRRLLPSQAVAGRIERMSPGRSIIGADELAAAWAVPVEAPELPGLTLANSRELPPAANVPRRGLVLGDSTVAGVAGVRPSNY